MLVDERLGTAKCCVYGVVGKLGGKRLTMFLVSGIWQELGGTEEVGLSCGRMYNWGNPF